MHVESTADGVVVTSDTFETEIDLSLDPGRYTLGIRPEDLSLGDGSGRIPATVDVVEPMGADNYLYLVPPAESDATAEIIARVDNQFRPDSGEEVMLDFDTENVHFFDETGERVPIEAAAEKPAQ